MSLNDGGCVLRNALLDFVAVQTLRGHDEQNNTRLHQAQGNMMHSRDAVNRSCMKLEERVKEQNGLTIVRLAKLLKSGWAETRAIDFILV